MVVLIANDGSKHCTAYARYLVAVKRGSYLSKDETVDHIDEDKTNDSIDNLQILSRRDNLKKHAKSVKSTPEHGTYSMYRTWKCRCELCKKARQTVTKRWYDKHKDEILQRRREKRKLKNKTTK